MSHVEDRSNGDEHVAENGVPKAELTLRQSAETSLRERIPLSQGSLDTGHDEARHSLKSQLQQSQKMEAIGRLAAGIAHDFNNILSVILGNVDLARNEPMGPVASQRRFTQLKLTDLALIVDESLRLLRVTLPALLSIEVHYDVDTPKVMADATQIEQVLINITTNAVQAMNGRRGRIGIRLDTVSLDAQSTNGQSAIHRVLAKYPGRVVRLAVTDNGPGMDAATVERIFEPLYPTKPVGVGTGPGLSVVHYC